MCVRSLLSCIRGANTLVIFVLLIGINSASAQSSAPGHAMMLVSTVPDAAASETTASTGSSLSGAPPHPQHHFGSQHVPPRGRNQGNMRPQGPSSRGGSRLNGTAGSGTFFKPEAIAEGREHRTTLMIRNIPNKYTQALLLEEVDRVFKDKV